MISVDTKKKELVGQYKNAGREWAPSGEPVQVKTHDFLDRQTGKAIPYGIYDTATNTGWVSVGTDHDTAAFAVASIRRWWQAQGRLPHPRVEDRTRHAGCRDGPGDHRLPPAAGYLEDARIDVKWPGWGRSG